MKILITVLRTLLIVVLCAVIALNVWMLIQQSVLGREAPEFLGYSQYVVTTGSMADCLMPGDMILVKAQEEYNLGDVVTFKDPQDSTVTHRLKGRVGGQFITQGDNNPSADPELLPPERIIGKVQTVFPGMGKVVSFLRSPVGLALLIAVGLLLIKLPDWAGVLKTKVKGKHTA